MMSQLSRTSYVTDTPISLGNREQDSSLVYEILHMERLVATVSERGTAEVVDEAFLPYDLYLAPGQDYETRDNNKTNFQYWCASRVLTLDRTYAKAILNSIGVTQSQTDADRANIARAYHCVSLTDVYWVRRKGEDITFAQLNLYDHSLNAALVDIPLRGRQLSVTNRELAQDLSTNGCFPKAWIRTEDGFFLLKDGGEDVVRKELLASRICQCFDIRQVCYSAYEYDGQTVTRSRIITSKERSIVSREAYEIYAANHELDAVDECIRLDPQTYYGMNILDYLVGNTDRHAGNWGLLMDTAANKPVSLHPLMDFNQSFLSYDTLDGANCMTTKVPMTQREAAMEAVKVIGLPQSREVDMIWFGTMVREAEMFRLRLQELKKYVS